MINFLEFMPSAINEPFLAKTKYGLRTVVIDPLMGFYRYTDCTHPFQNCNCNPYDIEEWEYVDKSKMEQLLFQKSWIGQKIRQEQADLILSQIKVSKIEKMFNKTKAFLLRILGK